MQCCSSSSDHKIYVATRSSSFVRNIGFRCLSCLLKSSFMDGYRARMLPQRASSRTFVGRLRKRLKELPIETTALWGLSPAAGRPGAVLPRPRGQECRTFSRSQTGYIVFTLYRVILYLSKENGQEGKKSKCGRNPDRTNHGGFVYLFLNVTFTKLVFVFLMFFTVVKVT